MSDSYRDLKAEFQDEDYRYGYAESFLNTKLASQIKALREERNKTQAEIAAQMGIKQPGYRRFEDANHSVWKTDSLWAIARAFGVRLNISFETFGSLLSEKKNFNKSALRRNSFDEDPVFNEHPEYPQKEFQGHTMKELAEKLSAYANATTAMGGGATSAAMPNALTSAPGRIPPQMENEMMSTGSGVGSATLRDIATGSPDKVTPIDAPIRRKSCSTVYRRTQRKDRRARHTKFAVQA